MRITRDIERDAGLPQILFTPLAILRPDEIAPVGQQAIRRALKPEFACEIESPQDGETKRVHADRRERRARTIDRVA